jgi:hypothetical protein
MDDTKETNGAGGGTFDSKIEVRRGEEMRNLFNVINDMLKVIPDDERVLIGQLKGIQYCVMYKAPEVQEEFWRECSKVLNILLGDKVNVEWAKKVHRIYHGSNNEPTYHN